MSVVRSTLLIAASAALAGCSLFSSREGTTTAPPAQPVTVAAAPVAQPPSPEGLSNPIIVDAIAPSVNVFGELDGQPRRSVASADVSFTQHTASEEGSDADVCVDPTGKWLLFSSTRHNEKADVYLQKVDGQSVIQLTTDPADDVQPVFSPDGKHIAFASSRSGNWDIYVMDSEGRNVELITGTAAHELHPSFSPDGTRLVYSALSTRSEQWEIWVIDLASRQRRMLAQGLFPTWSPRKDLDRIAFQRPRARGSRWFSVWTIDIVEGEPRRLAEIAVSSNAAAVSPSWSPDGTRLAFTTILTPQEPGSDRVGAKRDVWVVNADGSNRQRLTEGKGTNLSPVWGPDSRVYFVSDRGGKENIWSVRVQNDGTATAGTPKKEKSAVGSSE